jgi:hypothetical protein
MAAQYARDNSEETVTGSREPEGSDAAYGKGSVVLMAAMRIAAPRSPAAG